MYNCDLFHCTCDNEGNDDIYVQQEEAQQEEIYVTSYDPTDDGTVEFYMASNLARLSPYAEGVTIEDDHYLVFILKQSADDPDDVTFTAVINRECNNLSAEDIKKHKKEVNKAKLEELRRWHDMKCFRRMRRRNK